MASVTEPTFFNFATLGITACSPTGSNSRLILMQAPPTSPEPSPFSLYPIVIPTTRAYGFSG